MSARVTFHGFDGYSHSWPDYGSMIEAFAAGKMPPGWEWNDEAAYDRDFIAQQDRYSLLEMYHVKSGDEIEVLFFDGCPVGVLDNPHIGLLDLNNYETLEDMERRQGREDAARELNAAARYETPTNDIWHRIARRRV